MLKNTCVHRLNVTEHSKVPAQTQPFRGCDQSCALLEIIYRIISSISNVAFHFYKWPLQAIWFDTRTHKTRDLSVDEYCLTLRPRA